MKKIDGPGEGLFLRSANGCASFVYIIIGIVILIIVIAAFKSCM